MNKNNPIRCYEGSAKPHEPFWAFRNAAETESGETEIEFYGPISEFSWWGDEITPAMFKKELNEKGGGAPVTLRVNSYGGDLIAASVIRAIIIDYPGRVTAKIDGMAASAAVTVITGADRVQMQVSAYLFIHEALIGIMGNFNIADFKEFIDELKTVNAGIVDTYVARTKLDAAKLQKMMADETIMSASDAVALGFADEIISGPNKNAEQVSDQLRNYVNHLKTNYVNVNIPRALLAAAGESSEPRQAGDVERKAQRLAAQARIFLNKE